MNHNDLTALLAEHMHDPATQWSLGTFGAIAEFARDTEEPATVTALSAVTARGAIRLAPADDMTAVAFETSTKESWNHRVALCLPQDRCAMSRRTVLTELGPDDDALREQDRGSTLFDLGLGAWQVDCCIRVADAALASALRAQCGHPVFDHGNPAMGLIIASSPHRVFIGAIGRVEVFQPIPPPDGTSPEGPHTHVLPALLRSGRTHPATEPIPALLTPCAHLYPPHPAKDDRGRVLPFDTGRHQRFQNLLRQFGDSEIMSLKEQVLGAVHTGARPDSIALPNRRFARTAVRVALRQLAAAGESNGALSPWIAAYEPSHTRETSDDIYAHEVHAS